MFKQGVIQQLPKPKTIKNGDHIYMEEPIFTDNNGKKDFLGIRQLVVKILGPSTQNYLSCEVTHCEGVNAFPVGAQIDRPYLNLKQGFECSEYLHGKILAAGGYITGYDKSGKKVTTDDATKGGMAVGASHAEGGIKGVVGGEKKIEIERKEPVITADVSTNPKKYSFNGKELTGKEVLSAINQENGGVPLADGGDLQNVGTDQRPLKFKGSEMIITSPVTSNPKKYNFNGKEMTGVEIASCINQDNGGLGFAKGGNADCGCAN